MVIWRASVRSGYQALSLKRSGKPVPTFKDDLHGLLDANVHKLLMTPPTLCLFVFTVIPLVYMMCMAFTNYSKETDNLILFDWVGIDNFINIFNPNHMADHALITWLIIH